MPVCPSARAAPLPLVLLEERGTSKPEAERFTTPVLALVSRADCTCFAVPRLAGVCGIATLPLLPCAPRPAGVSGARSVVVGACIFSKFAGVCGIFTLPSDLTIGALGV
jgi:hypothetical protein